MDSHRPIRYVYSIVFTAIGVVVQFYLISYIDTYFTGLLYPATFLVAWYLGFGPAMLSIVVSFFAANYFFFEPYYSLALGSHADLIRLSMYALTSTMTSWMVARGRRSLRSETRNLSTFTETQRRFKRSTSAINLGIWYCDLPFDELIWDDHVKEHFWLPTDARVTIDTFYERIHPEDRERTRKAIEHSIATSAPYDIVYRTTNPKDPQQVKHVRAIGWTDYDELGKPIRFDGITLDQTKMVQTSADLKESLEVVETINRVGSNLSAELDQKKLVQLVTDAATQLSRAQFGAFFYNLVNEKGESYTLYTVSGVPIEKFNRFPMPRNTAVFAPTFAGEGIIRSDDITKDPRYGKNEPYFGKPEGHLPVTSYLAVPVISRSGEVIGGLFLGHERVGVFTDREERIVAGLASQVAIAMDNARLFQQASESIRMRDEFLSISSHELRTPLTSLKLQIQMFARYLDQESDLATLKQKLQKTLTVSDQQLGRLNSLVEDLLDVSRISSGRLTLNLEAVDVPELVSEVIDRYRHMLSASKTELEVHSLEKLVTTLDRLRFEQILINLLSNSVKYAPGSKIRVDLYERGSDLVLQVTDYGPGIDPKDQERIFKRFERIQTTNAQAGLGLGLYIVHQIVEAHGGKITLRSEKDKGTAFEVTIPIVIRS